MAPIQRNTEKVSSAEYLERERKAKFKSELAGGVMVALWREVKNAGGAAPMAGASKEYMTVEDELVFHSSIAMGNQAIFSIASRSKPTTFETP